MAIIEVTLKELYERLDNQFGFWDTKRERARRGKRERTIWRPQQQDFSLPGNNEAPSTSKFRSRSPSNGRSIEITQDLVKTGYRKLVDERNPIADILTEFARHMEATEKSGQGFPRALSNDSRRRVQHGSASDYPNLEIPGELSTSHSTSPDSENDIRIISEFRPGDLETESVKVLDIGLPSLSESELLDAEIVIVEEITEDPSEEIPSTCSAPVPILPFVENYQTLVGELDAEKAAEFKSILLNFREFIMAEFRKRTVDQACSISTLEAFAKQESGFYYQCSNEHAERAAECQRHSTILYFGSAPVTFSAYAPGQKDSIKAVVEKVLQYYLKITLDDMDISDDEVEQVCQHMKPPEEETAVEFLRTAAMEFDLPDLAAVNLREEPYFAFCSKTSPFSNYHHAPFWFDSFQYETSCQAFDHLLGLRQKGGVEILSKGVKSPAKAVEVFSCSTDDLKLMRKILVKKFSANPHILKTLITFNFYLIACNEGETFWSCGLSEEKLNEHVRSGKGPCDWPGQNWLGILLMSVRQMLEPF